MSVTFSTYVQAIVDRAGDEAQQEGAAAIEAQHLLLAIAAESQPATQQVLGVAGLNYRAVRTALQREFENGLGVAGVSLEAFDTVLRPEASQSRPTQLGASAKLALERGFVSGKHRSDLFSLHLLRGILQAQQGTVPRALVIAGVNQSELMVRLLEVLTDQSE